MTSLLYRLRAELFVWQCYAEWSLEELVDRLRS